MPERYGNAYYFDKEGIWRYVHNREPVPDASTFYDETGEAQLCAPELMAHAMFDTGKLAEFLHVTTQSIWTMANSTKVLPPAQVKLPRCSLWARPIIENWVAQRRRHNTDWLKDCVA